jgi:hypothetical protein
LSPVNQSLQQVAELVIRSTDAGLFALLPVSLFRCAGQSIITALAGQPIEARPSGPVKRTLKWGSGVSAIQENDGDYAARAIVDGIGCGGEVGSSEKRRIESGWPLCAKKIRKGCLAFRADFDSCNWGRKIGIGLSKASSISLLTHSAPPDIRAIGSPDAA